MLQKTCRPVHGDSVLKRHSADDPAATPFLLRRSGAEVVWDLFYKQLRQKAYPHMEPLSDSRATIGAHALHREDPIESPRGSAGVHVLRQGGSR